jgi:hypothetical protein
MIMKLLARRNGADWSLFFNGVNVANQTNLGEPDKAAEWRKKLDDQRAATRTDQQLPSQPKEQSP